MHGPRGAGRRLTILVAAAALTALSGCGTQGSVGAADPPKGGDLPVTERAIAAIALDHLPTNTSTRRPLRDSSSRDLQGTLAVDLRYRGEETVGVGVLSGADFDIEADLDMDGECTNCEERTVEGARSTPAGVTGIPGRTRAVSSPGSCSPIRSWPRATGEVS